MILREGERAKGSFSSQEIIYSINIRRLDRLECSLKSTEDLVQSDLVIHKRIQSRGTCGMYLYSIVQVGFAAAPPE